MTEATTEQAPTRPRLLVAAFSAGAAVGILGGLIGLGGAEFRLPLLIGVFGFVALQAVIINKALSLVVVLAALPARLAAVPAEALLSHWPIVVNMLAGSLLGTWAGATWATRMRSSTLYKVLAALLVLIAAALAFNHFGPLNSLTLATGPRIIIGVVAGFGIGTVAAIMGVAGGELLIPAIVLLFAVDIKTAGCLSLAVSLPTMLVAFARYSRDASFTVLRRNTRFLLAMAAGSVIGAVIGGQVLGSCPTASSYRCSCSSCSSPQPRSRGTRDVPPVCPRPKTPALITHPVHRSGRLRMAVFGAGGAFATRRSAGSAQRSRMNRQASTTCVG